MGQKPSRLSGSIDQALDTLLDVTIQGLDESKDTIVAALPVPGLSIALNVTIELLKKVQSARTNGEEIHGLCEEVSTLGTTLGRLAKMVQDALVEYPEGSPERKTVQEGLLNDVGLVARVQRLQSSLERICDEAEKLCMRSGFGRFVHSSSDAKALTNIKDKIAIAHRDFQTESGIRTETIVSEALGNIKRVITLQVQAEKERVLDSIPRAPDAPYLSAANAPKARFQEGTRDDILRHLKRWEDAHFETQTQTEAHPVCVLVGEAGTGKSTIASEFAKRLDSRSRLGASFFFNRGVSDLNSPKKFFSTIASQLARSQPALRDPVVAAARAHLIVAPLQQLEREYHDLLETPLSTLPSDHPPIFVVVDALDECTEEGPDLVPTLLRLLLSCAARPECPLRVFVTSRPEPHYIHRAFAITKLQPYISTVQIQSFRGSVDRDIELLIRARLGEDERSRTWSEANPEIVSRLVSKADGLFIYARTAVDFILGDLSSLQQRYEVLMPVKKAFKLKPLDELYRIVLNDGFPEEELYYQRRETLSAVLGYLVTIQDPNGVSPNTLELLTNLPAKASVPILNALRSVVFFRRDDYNCPFRILHATFREFLTERARSGDDFYVDAEPFHRKLVVACARIVLFFTEDRTRYGYAPLSGYARAHLVYHCEQIRGDSDLLENPEVKSALKILEQLGHDRNGRPTR